MSTEEKEAKPETSSPDSPPEPESEDDYVETTKIITLLRNINALVREKMALHKKNASFYRTIDLFLFSVPLIILHVTNAAMTHLVEDQKLNKYVTTTLSALATLMIAVQIKLGWSAMSKKFVAAARGYQTIQLEAENLYAELSTKKHDGSQLSNRKAGKKFLKFLSLAKKILASTSSEIPMMTCCWRRKFVRHGKMGLFAEETMILEENEEVSCCCMCCPPKPSIHSTDTLETTDERL